MKSREILNHPFWAYVVSLLCKKKEKKMDIYFSAKGKENEYIFFCKRKAKR